MLISWVVVLIALAGVLMMALSANPKVQQIGLVCFLCGLMVTCFLLGGRAIRIG